MTITHKRNDSVKQRKLIRQLNARLPELEPGALYNLEDILGPSFWGSVDEPHRALGIVFSNLVKDRRVPFDYAGLTKQRANRYRYLNY
jgi:hypothetical protein